MDHIDLLINNAGIRFTARVEDFPPSKWDDFIAINQEAGRAASPIKAKLV